MTGLSVFDPAFRADPYPHYRRLREAAPVAAIAPGTWVLTRHADCTALLRDSRFGHLDSDTQPTNPMFGQISDARGRVYAPDGTPVLSFLLQNPPDHTRLRRVVSGAFTTRMVARLEPRVEQIVDGLLDDALSTGTVDLIPALAYPLPVTVISELLGVPPEDHTRFAEWSNAIARGVDPAFLLPRGVVEQVARARGEFQDYFRGLAALRRRRPSTDLLSALVSVDELTEAELLVTCTLLLVAGHETTVNLIGNGTLALLRHPEALARFRADPSIAADVIEELLRYDSPVQLAGRTALTDAEIAGVSIARGDLILGLVGSANRDPVVFGDPDRLDLDRAAIRHLSFGNGIHFCLGAPLARLEGRIALRRLIERAPGLRLVGEPRWKENVVLRGLDHLPVDLDTSAGAQPVNDLGGDVGSDAP
ncbi:MAG: cytochrome P450 [Pseudonocardia sp.]